MAYEALARKWRPQSFDQIVEQPQVTQTLQNAISSGRIHHAYLFCGPRGTGKTTTARILAKALNCVDGPTPTPCGQCEQCEAIRLGNSLDVLEIDAASNTGVDNIRDLRERARYVPVSARYKIYIIDEVHRLSDSAFDALLKTLEEPPDSVIFMFATTEPNEVPATVRSRTLRFDFRLITHEALAGALARIAQNEGIEIDENALSIIATEAGGSLRDGQSLLDQMAGYSAGLITADLVHEALGLVDTEILFETSDAFAAHDAERALAAVGEVSRMGRDLVQYTRQLAEHLKRLLFAHALGEKYKEESLNKELAERYRAAAQEFDENDLLRLLMMTVEVGNRLKKASHPRLEVELLAMRAAHLDRSVDIRKLVDQLGGAPSSAPANPFGSNRMATPPPPSFSRPAAPATAPRRSTPAPRPAPPPSRNTGPRAQVVEAGSAVAVADTPDEEETPAKPARSSETVNFQPILESICESRPTLRAILGEAELVRSGPGTIDLIVYKGSQFHQRQLATKPVRDLINAEIARALGEGLRVTIHVRQEGPAKPGNGSGTAQPSMPASTDPQIAGDHNLQEILRRFDGEIVG